MEGRPQSLILRTDMTGSQHRTFTLQASLPSRVLLLPVLNQRFPKRLLGRRRELAVWVPYLQGSRQAVSLQTAALVCRDTAPAVTSAMAAASA